MWLLSGGSDILRDMAKQVSTVTLVGGGNLAHALASLLPRAGIAVQEIVTRGGRAKGKVLVRKARNFENANFSGEVVWLAVSDGAIAECSKRIAERGDWNGKIVLHSSGALTSDELQALRKRGAKVASLHPLMTFVAGKAPVVKGVAWTVEGDREAVRVARRITRALGGEAHEIAKERKALYHAFGAFLSPLLVALLDRAAEVAKVAGIPEKETGKLMRPIVIQTVENLFASIGGQGGPGKAFSGPLVRGDVETIKRHLEALRGMTEARKLYKALVSSAIKSELPVKKRAEIARLLGRSR